MALIFWLSISLIIYSYLVYPLVLFLFSHFFKKKHTFLPCVSSELPDVAVVISAFNEESCIKERINNLLSLDYPHNKIKIYIGSDGSTDSTNEILSTFDDPRLLINLYQVNRGKANVLNELISQVTQPITVFSDANTNFEPDAITNLVRHFQDDTVGAVCGELNLFTPIGVDNKDNVYWRYEQFLKSCESKLDALLGANGAIYAIRTHLYTQIPKNTIVDDFLIVMNVAKAKYRVIYDTSAVAHEEVAPNITEETKRRIRIGTGNYQAFTHLTWVLNPLIGWRFFSYFSHKILRWFTPHFLILAFLSNAYLVGAFTYNIIFIIQLISYTLAFWGKKQSDMGNKIPSSISFLTFFVSMNIALLKGFYNYAFKNVQGTWQRTLR